MKKNYIILIILIIIYFALKYFIPYGNYLVYPINLLVTFLHELGHSLFAILTWGEVKSVQVNLNGSGYATTVWGIETMVLMGGYVWSAIFWNILLYIWFKKQNLAQIFIYILSVLLILTGIVWFNSIIWTLILFSLAWIVLSLSKNKEYDALILQFLWITTLLYIIEDFNVWPSSDIEKFGNIFVIIPDSLWMIIWLLIVLWLTSWNIKKMINK
jgi:hypothetical protein